MTATIYIWLPCVMLAWAPASGPVAQYQLQTRESVNITSAFVASSQNEACFPRKRTDYYIIVRGIDANGAPGPWSGYAIIRRVHDFDSDGDGWVGFLDYSELLRSYLDQYHPNGTVTRH